MTKKLPLSLAAFLLFGTVCPTLFAQVAPAPPIPPQAPAASMPAVAPLAPLAPSAAAPLAPQEEAAPPAPVTPPAAPAGAAPFAFGSVFFQGDNYLGVSIEEVTRENMGRYGLTGEPRGVAVTRVVKGSPAERAGLRESDVILRYDGEPVSNYRKLNRLIDESVPEHNARLTIRRGGSEQEINVTLGRRQGFGTGVEGSELLRAEELRRHAEELRRNNQGVYSMGFGRSRRIGVSTTTLGKQLADYFGVTGGGGVLISAVEENSPADRAGLKAGDVITEADGERVGQTGDLSRALNRRDEGEITLTVVRDRKQRTVKVTPERSESPGFFSPDVWVTSPVATISLPRISMTLPRITVTTPRVTVAPRVYTLPRVRPSVRVGRPVLSQPVL